MIANPEYEPQADVYKLPPLKFVGFELWQARAQLAKCCRWRISSYLFLI